MTSNPQHAKERIATYSKNNPRKATLTIIAGDAFDGDFESWKKCRERIDYRATPDTIGGSFGNSGNCPLGIGFGPVFWALAGGNFVPGSRGPGKLARRDGLTPTRDFSESKKRLKYDPFGCVPITGIGATEFRVSTGTNVRPFPPVGICWA
jgi:hypothetical protein